MEKPTYHNFPPTNSQQLQEFNPRYDEMIRTNTSQGLAANYLPSRQTERPKFRLRTPAGNGGKRRRKTTQKRRKRKGGKSKRRRRM
jgi:hypothetical protein